MKQTKTAVALICICLFVFFVVVGFPFQNLRGFIFSNIYQQTGILVIAEDMYLTLFGWPGIGLRNVTATLPPKFLGEEVEISSKKMTVRVGIGGLLPPRLSYSVSITGMKKGGDLFLKLNQLDMRGQQLMGIKASFDFDEVHLEQFGIGGVGPDAISGVVSGDGNFQVDMNDLSKSVGSVDLTIADLKMPAENLQGIVFPIIHMGTLTTKIAIRNGVVEINNFQFGNQGSDIQGSITGELRLGRDIIGSYLNLTSLKLKMTDKFRDDPNSATIVSTFNSFDNRVPGSYNMKWTEPIAKIAQNFLFAPPVPN